MQRDIDPPVPEPLPPPRVSWQNVLLIALALLVVGMITAMIVWRRSHSRRRPAARGHRPVGG